MRVFRGADATPPRCACRVSFVDIAAVVLGRPPAAADARRVEAVAEALGVSSAPDWAGRGSVAHGDAAAVVAEWVRRRQAADAQSRATVQAQGPGRLVSTATDGVWDANGRRATDATGKAIGS